jgi:hypothetical protein
MLALAGPVDGHIVHANQSISCQLGRLLPRNDRLDDVGGQVGEP